MLTFENGLDIRTRQCAKPEVARIRVTGTTYAYCVIGTDYGHWHTSGGDVRTWKTASGAQRALKRYTPL